MLFTFSKKMKIGIIVGLILVSFISGCNSSPNISAPNPNVQPEGEKQPADFAMQTIIAREQLAETPTLTPTEFTNLPKPWTEIATITPTPEPIPLIPTQSYQISAMATAPVRNSIIYQGPGFSYRMACYVQEGTQLIITGQTTNSAWLQVSLGQDQSCITMVGNIIIESVRRDLNMQFWISASSYYISGNLSEIPVITQ